MNFSSIQRDFANIPNALDIKYKASDQPYEKERQRDH